MPPKLKEKAKAIELRRKGFSYSEIQKKVHVSNSSLSLWLKNINLTSAQKKRLIRKGNLARGLGSVTLKLMRIKKTKEIVEAARLEIKQIDNESLNLIGITLYWAEGSKQKVHDPSKEVIFSNSDPYMIKIYLKWLRECLLISEDRIVFEIYIHKSHNKSVQNLAKYWSVITGFPKKSFSKVYYKENKIHSLRKNRGPDYSGVLRISVRKSTDLNRKIQGWIKGVCFQSGVASSNEL